MAVSCSLRRVVLHCSPLSLSPYAETDLILAHCIQNADIASFFILCVGFSCPLKSAECEWKKAYAYRVECANGSIFFLDNLFIMISKVAIGAAAALMAGVVGS